VSGEKFNASGKTFEILDARFGGEVSGSNVTAVLAADAVWGGADSE